MIKAKQSNRTVEMGVVRSFHNYFYVIPWGVHVKWTECVAPSQFYDKCTGLSWCKIKMLVFYIRKCILYECNVDLRP